MRYFCTLKVYSRIVCDNNVWFKTNKKNSAKHVVAAACFAELFRVINDLSTGLRLGAI
ncbi:hypothetical protein FD15_GL001472 [Liquorilactobacillus sucicola DSM 21376 = JCM 15457]|uniref:Uncharacterized protein n=1 Tax=Liquorilactobacillus sucicola DSM 21376 = JCM 15457 TaxID=1423806 RepID=A0A0R2DQF8_9LACO|nr:hypothetical protein FD15_GL001472 [Liquorilactobacillus sucicola DSM 21376 = JCM 15457]